MRVNRDMLGACVLLAGFIAYGMGATQIALFPGQESAAFTPRTMPLAIAITGALLSLLQAVVSFWKSDSADQAAQPTSWIRVVVFCLFVVAYSVLLSHIGFVIATVLFLTSGFAVLGERRPVMLIVLPVVFTVVFWFFMSRVLGLYLDPGSLWLSAG